jgi:hypothetical protein
MTTFINMVTKVLNSNDHFYIKDRLVMSAPPSDIW